MPQGGARRQNLGHLTFFYFYFYCMESFNCNNRYYVRVTLSVTSDHG